MAVASAPFGPHSASAAELKEQLAAERGGAPFLVFRDGGGAQRIAVLAPDAGPVTIGRAEGTDLCLSWDDGVSRVHAELVRVGPDWAIADDGLSRNGTFVNGDRVAGRLRLRGGDLISVGSTAIAFRAPGAAVEETADAHTRARPALTAAQRRVLVALCRPYRGGATHAAPATNRQIADDLFLSIEGVKTQVRALFDRFGVEDLPQNAKRAKLVEYAFSSGTITQRDLDEA